MICVIYFLIVLVRLVGLIYVDNGILRQICLFDQKITWLLLKVAVILPNISSISLERGEFLYSKCAFNSTIKNVLDHWYLIRIPYCLQNTTVSFSRFCLIPLKKWPEEKRSEHIHQTPDNVNISNNSLRQCRKKDKKYSYHRNILRLISYGGPWTFSIFYP